ncbi:MAG TPA: MFS transporter, partial [Planctomycetota bacterium]|nr:MFS transporter [Planctomycetota bacterium]
MKSLIEKFTVMRGAPRELWIIYITKILEIVAYGLMSSTLILWLSADLGFSDAAAGDTVAWWSTIMTLVTIVVGSLVDTIGIRKSFLLGFWLCLLPRGVMTVADNTFVALAFGLFPMAIGLALMIPVMNAAIKRYSTPAQQTMAFAFFYIVMNIGFAISGWLF